MPIDIHKYYGPRISALAREQGMPEEIIEPKSIKYGTEYSFPANMHYELEEGGVRMYEKYAAYMADKYDETIMQAIAAEARKEGFTKVVILDKWKILKALAAANPEDFPDMEKVTHCKDCICGHKSPGGLILCKFWERGNSPAPGLKPDDYCSYGERRRCD